MLSEEVQQQKKRGKKTETMMVSDAGAAHCIASAAATAASDAADQHCYCSYRALLSLTLTQDERCIMFMDQITF